MDPLGAGRSDETVFAHLWGRAVVIIHTVTCTHTCKRALRLTCTDVVEFGMEWKEERWMLATTKGRE